MAEARSLIGRLMLIAGASIALGCSGCATSGQYRAPEAYSSSVGDYMANKRVGQVTEIDNGDFHRYAITFPDGTFVVGGSLEKVWAAKDKRDSIKE